MKDTLRAFFLVGGVFSFGLMAGSGTVRGAFGAGQSAYAGLEAYALALNKIEQSYVEEIAPKALVHASIRGMVNTLDPHSIWLSPEDYQALQDRADGRYLGIGVELGEMNGAQVTIETVTPRGPAALAGVQAGDVLRAIDGDSLTDMSTADVLALLSGSIGDPVELALLREDQPLTLTVVRDEVVDISVTGERLPDDLGYIRIEHFHRRIATETAYALEDLQAEGDLSGLILDFRDNPGGLITEAVEMVDLFVTEGTIVEVRRRDGTPEVHVATERGDLQLPIVVLINEGSASASELVAGALQDVGRATLVGMPSYGKGSMQHVYLFRDGSALKLTVARYYLPSGNSIQPGVGLLPDHTVALQGDQSDPVAALQHTISTLDIAPEQQAELQDQIDALPLHTPSSNASVPRGGTLEERLEQDAQLAAAVTLLQGG